MFEIFGILMVIGIIGLVFLKDDLRINYLFIK